MPRKSVTVTSSRAPAVRRTWAASCPLNRELTVTITAPARKAPSAATTHPAEFGAHSATRSPGSTPAATYARAARSAAAASSVKLSRSSPSTSASRSPWRAAACSTTAGKVPASFSAIPDRVSDSALSRRRCFRFFRLSTPSTARAVPIASSHESLASGVPAWVGWRLPSSRMPGLRR